MKFINNGKRAIVSGNYNSTAMEINVHQQHKSIIPPCKFELPEFSVLTGKNGSGKTHLLEAISDMAKSEVTLNGLPLHNIRYIGFNGLSPAIQEICDPNSISGFTKGSWSQYSKTLLELKKHENNNLTPERLYDYMNFGENQKKFIRKVVESLKKPLDDIKEDDFADQFEVSFISEADFFTAQFALIFKTYHKRLEENNINEYYFSKGYPLTKPVLSKDEFEQNFGQPPWDFVNKILTETKIPYEVNDPIGTRVESSFTFKLKDKISGFEISSSDLSTGEKVLMSLALAIYNTGDNFGKPDLLLLDEPDAGLHPSMSKLMVDVLKKNIVIENKIPTIISTHSPTTIIASEGISIYQMIRGSATPTKIPTQQAIELLSSDIPFLRISNEKRRQVFVESKFDVNYYELLTNIFSRIEPLSAEPIYLPARTSIGSNCTDVIEIVNSLTKHGNEQVYGIVDWDKKNSTKDRLIVLGENQRYAIENYLLDPLLMGLLFIRERKKDFTYFGIQTHLTYSDVSKLSQNDAQKISDTVLQDLGLNSSNLIDSTLLNGWSLSISTEFATHQGHDLEALYKSKYPFLNSYQKEDGLKKDVIEKVINDYPNLASKEIFETIKKVK